MELVQEFDEALSEEFPDSWPVWLRFGPPRLTWSDGLALRLETECSGAEVVGVLAPILDEFRAWTVFRSLAEVQEKTPPLLEDRALLTGPLAFYALLASPDRKAVGDDVAGVQGVLKAPSSVAVRHESASREGRGPVGQGKRPTSNRRRFCLLAKSNCVTS